MVGRSPPHVSSWRSNGLLGGGGGEEGGLGGHCQYSFSVCLSVVAKISDKFSSRQRQRDNFRIISDNATSDNFSASRHWRVVAKIVASAQLWS